MKLTYKMTSKDSEHNSFPKYIFIFEGSTKELKGLLPVLLRENAPPVIEYSAPDLDQIDFSL